MNKYLSDVNTSGYADYDDEAKRKIEAQLRAEWAQDRNIKFPPAMLDWIIASNVAYEFGVYDKHLRSLAELDPHGKPPEQTEGWWGVLHSAVKSLLSISVVLELGRPDDWPKRTYDECRTEVLRAVEARINENIKYSKDWD